MEELSQGRDSVRDNSREVALKWAVSVLGTLAEIVIQEKIKHPLLRMDYVTQVSESSSEKLQYSCLNIIYKAQILFGRKNRRNILSMMGDGHSVMNSNFMGITTQKTGPDIS